MRLKRILKDKKGESSILTVSIILGIFIIICSISEMFRLTIIAKGVREALQSSVISVATSNYDDVYNGTRESYSGGYTLKAGNWFSETENYDVYNRMNEILGTRKEGKYYVKEQDKGYEYRFYDVKVEIKNVPLAQGNANKNFEANVTATLEVPLSFGWEHLLPINMKIKTKATYTPKF